MTTPRVIATVELGLGGSYWAQVVEDGPNRHDFRSELLYESSFYNSYTIKNRGQRVYGGGLLPMVLWRAGVAVSDREQSAAGVIPEGGPGVRFRSAEAEWGTVLFNTIQDPLSIECVVTVHQNPSAPVAVVGMAFSSSNYQGFGIWIDASGNIKGYAKLAGLTTLDGGAITLGARTHIVLTQSGSAGSRTFKLYVNGVLMDTDTGDFSPNVTWIFGADDDLTPSATLDATYYHACIYQEATLTLTQVQNHYAALAWTDVTSDVFMENGFAIERGFRSTSLTTRIPDIGFCTFTLDNGVTSLGTVKGYYSPGHASAHPYFRRGCALRVSVGSTVVFHGRLSAIVAEPGQYQGRRTMVSAVDLFGPASRSTLQGTPLMESVTSGRVFEATVAGMSVVAPTEVIIGDGSDTYPTALDNSADEEIVTMDEWRRIADSEFGYIFARRTGAVEFQGRTERLLNYGTSSLTVNDTMVALGVAEDSDTAVNRVDVTVHPRQIDSVDTTVLASLDSEIELGPGASVTFIAPYRNENLSTVSGRVGGKDMRTPVATTDYTMFSATAGGGSNLTASLSVEANYGPNSVEWTLLNQSTTTVGFVNFLQGRGRGIYDLAPVVLSAKADDAIERHGLNTVRIDMPYQSDPNVGQALAQYLLDQFQALTATAQQVTLLLNDTYWNLNVLDLDISDRITVTETQTGVDADYHIQGVRLDLSEGGGRCDLSWWLIPADIGAFWELGTAGKSELDLTTVLF